MSGGGAFENEMGFPSRISDEDAERLLGGSHRPSGDAALAELTSFVTAVRAVVPPRSDPGAEEILVRKLAETARAASREEAARPTAETRTVARGTPMSQRIAPARPRLAIVGRIAVAAALLPAAVAGLAFAGVTVPEPARDAFEAVGAELPNQPDESSTEATGGGGARGGSEASGSEGRNGKAKAKSKKNDAGKPGRRVRRYGEGPVPGPASPPEGKALGYSKGAGNPKASGGTSGKARGRGHAKKK